MATGPLIGASGTSGVMSVMFNLCCGRGCGELECSAWLQSGRLGVRDKPPDPHAHTSTKVGRAKMGHEIAFFFGIVTCSGAAVLNVHSYAVDLYFRPVSQ